MKLQSLIVHNTPFVTVKAAMSLDGKVATASVNQKLDHRRKARGVRMRLRQGSDAISRHQHDSGG